MLGRHSIKAYIEEVLHLKVAHHVRYADRYDTNTHSFYLKSNDTRPLVIHPLWKESLSENPIEGADLKDLYHNSALSRFPRLSGPNREPCGYDVEILDISALEGLMRRIGAIAEIRFGTSSAIADIKAAEPILAQLSETERQTLIAARLGQGLFRDRLMSAWAGRCAVTGTTISALIRASHIKPWRVSNNDERLDPENGFMLVSNLDAAFDAGLISFRDDGAMLFSTELGPDPHGILGTRPGCALTIRPSGRRQLYLRHHRHAAKLG